MCESPRWLLSRGRRDEALKHLCVRLHSTLSLVLLLKARGLSEQWVRKLDSEDPYMLEEVDMMEQQLEHERALVGTSFWGPIRELASSRAFMHRVMLGGLLFIFQNGTGIVRASFSTTIMSM
jgi:hypothetical protein